MIDMDKNKDKESPAGKAAWYYRSGPLLTGFLIILLSLIIYLPTIKAPFVLDDEVNIIRNMRLHDLANFWPPVGSRYLAYLSFALNYSAGGLKTTGYHLVNIILHILSAMTLYGIVRSIFLTPAMRGMDNKKKGLAGNGNYVALIAALIFTVHPLNTQAVIYTTQRLTVMASLLYMLSIYLYLKWRTGESKGICLTPIFYAFSILAAIGAAKTKEISFTLPFIILFSEYVFFTQPGKWITRRRLYSLIPYAIVLIIIPLSLFGPELGLWGRASVMDDGFTRVQQILDIKELSPYTYLLTQFTVVPEYIRLFFIPLWQNLDYDYPLYTSLFNLRVIAGFAFLAFIFALSMLTVCLARRRRYPLLLLAAAGILWFFITLSIESTVIPIRDVIFEHRMYLPGVGLGVAVSALIVHLAGRGKERPAGKALLVTVLIVISALSALAFGRGLIWRDDIRLYEDIVRKSPNKARPHNNLGTLYAERGMTDKAVAEFREVLVLDPMYAGPHKNLARVLLTKGDLAGAAAELKAALRANPGDYDAHAMLGTIYKKQSLFALGEKEYKIVLSLQPLNIKARVNLADIYTSQGRFREVVSQYKKILLIRPDMIEVYYNLAGALEKTGLREEALFYYREFAASAPPALGKFRDRAAARIEVLSADER